MEPSYSERTAREGTTYRGEAFPLDEKLILRARADQSRRYHTLIDQHERNRRNRKVSFYSEFLTILFVLLSTILVLAMLVTRKKK